MEEQKKQFKFPVGAIFLFIYASLLFYKFLSTISFVFNTFIFISLLAVVGLGVLSIMKKRGLPILIPVAILTLINLIQFSVSDIPYIVMLACIILFSLDDMNIGNLAKYRNIAKAVFIIAVILYAVLKIVLDIVNIWTNPDIELLNGWIEIINYILHPVSMILIGLWIYNPYKSENKNTNSNVTSDYYVSLGKHICLLIFTFGIWQMIWVYKSTKFTNNAIGEEERNPTTKLLLYLFIPFYSIYWTYKTAQRLDIIAKDKNLNSDLATVCLILAIFIGIVPPILMQDKVNEIVKNSLQESNVI